MGQASRKLAHRLRHSRRGKQGWRQQAKHDAVRIPTDVKNLQHLVEHEGYDPISAHLPLFPHAPHLLQAAFCCLSGRAQARCASQVRTVDS